MRIFNKEKEKEIVYVQGKDIKFIEEQKIDSPPLDGIRKVVSDDTFVQFVDAEYVDFFKQQTYIPNYKTMRDISIDKLALIIEEKAKRIATITKGYESTPKDERATQTFFKEKAKREYEIASIQEYINTIKSKKAIPIPLAIDTDEMRISSHDSENDPINIGYSLDKKRLLFTKDSGKPFRSEDSIPKSLFFKAIAILAIETDIITESDELIDCRGKLSSDKKFIISEEFPSKEEDYEQEKSSDKIKEFFKALPKKLASIKEKNN